MPGPDADRTSPLPAREARLLDATDRALPGLARRARELARYLLLAPPGDGAQHRVAGGFRSSLNADGSPLQVCHSLAAHSWSTVLIADPGSEEPRSGQHHERGLSALAWATADRVGPSGGRRLSDLCRELLPDDVAGCADLAVGTLWLGIPLDSAGIGLYLNGAWGGGPQRWARVVRWLRAEGVPEAASGASIAAVSGFAHVSSLGIDLAGSGGSRLKVYFRLDRSVSLSDFGVAMWTDPRLRSFLAEVVGDRRLPLAGLVFCLSFSPGVDRVVDVKVDVCGHCLGDRADWPALFDRLSAVMGTASIDWAPWELGQSTQVAFLGAGSRRGGSTRWNVYLKGVA